LKSKPLKLSFKENANSAEIPGRPEAENATLAEIAAELTLCVRCLQQSQRAFTERQQLTERLDKDQWNAGRNSPNEMFEFSKSIPNARSKNDYESN